MNEVNEWSEIEVWLQTSGARMRSLRLGQLLLEADLPMPTEI